MNYLCLMLASAQFLSTVAAAAPPAKAVPAFYVVQARANGDALVHASASPLATSQGLPLIVLGSERPDCCFTLGARKAGVASTLKIDPDLPLLSDELGTETYQLAGQLAPALAARVASKPAFGVEGMQAARRTGNNSYDLTLAGQDAHVIVKHCLGTEGINFSLYRAGADKKPFASWYYALGYPVKADCR